MTGMNDWWDYLRLRQNNNVLAHSAKGTTWDRSKVKYIGKTAGGSYIYPKSVMKGWDSYIEPVGGGRISSKSQSRLGGAIRGGMNRNVQNSNSPKPQINRSAKRGNSLIDRAGKAAKGAFNRASGAWNSATGGDGLDLGDVRRWASGAVDAAGRTASDLYDRVRGNEVGSTWNRATRGDGHLNTSDVTDRVGSRAATAGKWVGDRANDAKKAVGGAWDRATGGDGLDVGDVKRWAGNAWDGASNIVDTVGRGASDLYDRVRGNEAGTTWNRATRGDGHLNTEDITDRVGSRAASAVKWIGDRANDARNAVGGAWNRATGEDGLDLGDVRRWANDAGRYAWDRASDAVDVVGRGASNLYDRVRGNEVGSTWNRATRGDNHLNTEDITDRVGAAATRGRQLFNAAGQRINDYYDHVVLGNEDETSRELYGMYEEFQKRANASGDPRMQELADSYLKDYQDYESNRSTWPKYIDEVKSDINGRVNRAVDAVRPIVDSTGKALNSGVNAVGNAINSGANAVAKLGSNAVDAAGKAINSGINAAGQFGTNVANRIEDTLNPQNERRIREQISQDPDAQNALGMYDHWMRQYNSSGDPRMKDLAETYLEDYEDIRSKYNQYNK